MIQYLRARNCKEESWERGGGRYYQAIEVNDNTLKSIISYFIDEIESNKMKI